MFIIASLDVAFHLRHNLEAFIWYNGPAIEVFNKTSSWINVVKMGCYVAQTFVGDSILVRTIMNSLGTTLNISFADIPMLDRLQSQLVGSHPPDSIVARNYG